jgi:hypothetical protein
MIAAFQTTAFQGGDGGTVTPPTTVTPSKKSAYLGTVISSGIWLSGTPSLGDVVTDTPIPTDKKSVYLGTAPVTKAWLSGTPLFIATSTTGPGPGPGPGNAPVITSLNPPGALQGTLSKQIVITGTGLSGAIPTIAGTGITISVVTSTEVSLLFRVDVAADATTGNRTLTVTTSYGSTFGVFIIVSSLYGGGILKRWTGYSWDKSYLKVYGSSFTNKPMKRFDYVTNSWLLVNTTKV